jgi:carbon starvation protein
MFGLMPAGQTLWVMFGTTNQLLAALTLLTVTLFLFKLGRPIAYTLIPMILMFAVAISAMVLSLIGFLRSEEKSWLLILTSVLVLAMACWLAAEGALSFARGRGGLALEDGPSRTPEAPAAAVAEAARQA